MQKVLIFFFAFLLAVVGIAGVAPNLIVALLASLAVGVVIFLIIYYSPATFTLPKEVQEALEATKAAQENAAQAGTDQTDNSYAYPDTSLQLDPSDLFSTPLQETPAAPAPAAPAPAAAASATSSARSATPPACPAKPARKTARRTAAAAPKPATPKADALADALHTVVEKRGRDELATQVCINILSDLHAFKELPAAKRVMQTLISEGYMNEILQITSWNAESKALAAKFVYNFGTQEELVQQVFGAIGYALGHKPRD